MHKMLVAVLTCCVYLGASALQLPAYIHKCSIKDPNINTCALNSAKEALPHLITGDRENLIPILDPLFVSELTVNDGKMNVVCRNMRIRGLKDLALESLSFDFDNKNITVEGRLPALNFNGNYEVSGKMVEHDISGNGHFQATFYDNSVKYTTSYDLNTPDDGQVYLVLQSYHLDLQPANLTAQLDNLFNGNKVLGDEMNKYINDNWRALLDQAGPKAYEALGLIIHKILREAATLVPYKDIFNETE